MCFVVLCFVSYTLVLGNLLVLTGSVVLRRVSLGVIVQVRWLEVLCYSTSVVLLSA